MSENWTTVTISAIPGAGEVVGGKVGDKQIAVYNIKGQLYATDNVCTHAFALLSDGYLDGDTIECPLHAGRFDVRTGKGLGPPITCDIKTYPVRIAGESVEINISE